MELATINKLIELASTTVWFDPAIHTEPKQLWVLVRDDWRLYRSSHKVIIFPSYDSACRWLSLRETGQPHFLPRTATPMHIERYAYECPPYLISEEGL